MILTMAASSAKKGPFARVFVLGTAGEESFVHPNRQHEMNTHKGLKFSAKTNKITPSNGYTQQRERRNYCASSQ